jgi:transposase
MEGTWAASVVRLMVDIAYNKGFIICERYDKMNGDYFADFIKRNFVTINVRRCDKDHVDYFLQDGDPRQNSKIAKDALESVKAKLFAIPPRSPDLNPIENVFHLANNAQTKDARTIEYETRDEFVDRIKRTLFSIPRETIDKTIVSMGKRLELIIKNNGERLKY